MNPDPVTFETPVGLLEWIPSRLQRTLEEAGLRTAGDLLEHYPRRHEDRRRFDPFPQEEGDSAVCLRGRVTNTSLRRFGRRRQFFEATLEDPEAGVLSSPIVCRWFNLPWIHRILAADQELVVFGRPKRSGRRLVIDHPEYEVIEDEAGERIHVDRITPVYPLREGLRQRPLREALFHLVGRFDWSTVEDRLREASEESEFAGLSRARALRALHFPESEEERVTARRYLALEEFFVLQLNVLGRRQAYASQPGAVHAGAGELVARFRGALPFPLTRAQERSLGEILADLRTSAPMNRLLQGDVGSGKTVVAAAAMLAAVESGAQAALMAPTQILAEQHFATLRGWFDPLGIRIALRTSNRKESSELPLFSGQVDETPQVVVGTHALLHDGVAFDRLGLVVIDEQHKFGVAQRTRLVSRGTVPDVLVMTATPIPRTLTLTVYGDLDVSVIDELPAGRRPVTTAVRPVAKLPDVTRFLRDQIGAGRQAYLVYPLIDESESLAAKAATTGFEEWRTRLEPAACGLLHGRLSPDEKDSVMTAFRDGRLAALVATTVIEVGVDVPNATVMVVFNAERFGLAQLHQLRGRVGRGAHKSYCILLAGSGEDKLRILEETGDGFRVAEADLALRGPGDVLGTAQSGLPGLRLGDLITDAPLVHLARRLAAEVVSRDPELADPAHARLKRLLRPAEAGTLS